MAQTMTEIMNPGATSKDPGFPQAPEDWSKNSAEAAAREEDITLSDDHWAAIKALQTYFDRNEQPNVRELHDGLNEAFHDKGGIKYLYEIFPGGPVAQGCRLAGLKPPAGAVDPSFGSVQ
ncbi:TusE/DsrC/DsvC family sulfur relay protein [Thiorhodococcus mannitoliphagus]|uniref:Sulfurtransferase n=1 Tax=Thiorhodococcus mannitoliphagus TaxID=329406 RepID=A0A6P1DSA8_9GAMM|nr:TusE/DsrC/DsvC family sulfur relay protein [Thiorhodococcus mannitoliphagus]NEX20440.1 TusE/DsrC/DsvC family sulfur relay protein [Thiorhodococcus mannitoliphagus]